MGVEWIAGTLIVLAIACLGGAAVLFFGDRWLMQWLRGTGGFLLAGLAVWLVLFASSLFSYQQVGATAPMATLSFEKAGTQEWMVTVAEANGDRRQFRVQGDLWQLDVRLLHYTGPLSVFGVAPSFRLERLESSYLTLEDQEGREHSDHLLVPEPLLGYDIWERAHGHGSLLLDATRSSIVLVPMREGAIFEVRLGERGLAVAPANSAAEDALRRISG